jgi:hypothetical protein
MNLEPASYSELRKTIAYKAWLIWCPSRPVPPVPPEFYNIAEVAIREVQLNVDKMISQTVKSRLENLLPPE